MGFCKTCIHTEVCYRDKNLFGEDMYVAPHPLFFDDEYKKKSWENYLKRKEQGFPCDKFLEIIHCKDCKYLRIKQDWLGNNGEELAQCKQWDAPISDMNGFCSWAERREDK